MLHVGIDIAKHDHWVGAVGDDGRRAARPTPFRNSREGFGELVAHIEGLGGDPASVQVGMEATGHCWPACFRALREAGYEAAAIDPMQTNAVRRLRNLGKVKTDAVDCELVAETVRIGAFEPSRLADDDLLSLRQLVRLRQSMCESASDLKRQLLCVLDQVFPEYAALFSDPFGESSLALLRRWGTPDALARARESTLAAELRRASHGRLGEERARQVREAAKGTCGVKLALGSFSLEVSMLVAQLDFISGQCDELEGRIGALLREIEPLVLTVPGVGVLTGAQIVAEVGDVSRFRNAKALVSYAGLNPSVSQSGRFEGSDAHITKQGSPYLRRALYLVAMSSLRVPGPFRDFYDKKRSEGKRHREALVATARKAAAVVYAVLRNQEPYDGSRVGARPA
ncbi:IS110 family transposase [Olsenella sp. YH-ols2217]|uniref:IS110 family transposase n=1 Tax=Kribbibacterium absianum TaxID=3044210 RepID=A0ABT6ZJG3_9ACTN|nr:MULTISPECIES: IS110 family transposase [unclassified Olsenella]MDJ1122815.1 IS110 family transposase [Olsenella sp. YH-ols2216]MDJ1129202.1 IS110 family transposase [Olsenella sp. YH-ols2217]